MLCVLCVYCKQGELEKLNQSTDDINRWESELEVRQPTVRQQGSPKHDLFIPTSEFILCLKSQGEMVLSVTH